MLLNQTKAQLSLNIGKALERVKQVYLHNMAYSNKNRYKTRRDKLSRNRRHLRIVFTFVAIAIAFLLIKNRVAIYDWLRYM